MSSENLVIIPEENLTETCFPITFEQVLIPRTKENEARYRHLTVLILGVYVNEGHKIMVINKNPKNRVRYPEKSFPEICRDIPGGHCIYSAIPEDELQSGKISEETVRSQAFKEFSEEVVFTKDQKVAFRERDFKFVGFYPYDGPDNRELSALFTLAIPFYDGELQTQDNVGDVICSLPNEAISYQQLSDEWQNRHENKEALRFEDGLGRLMMKGDLLKQIEKVQL